MPEHASTRSIAVSVVGASGYTGAELVRLLLGHRQVRLVGAYGKSTSGSPLAEVVPSLRGMTDLSIRELDVAEIASSSECVFVCLPHGRSAPIVRELREGGIRVIDLSADFRLRSVELYQQWYNAHRAPELVGEAVYGFVELYRAPLREADLIAVPGCYPTATIAALAPLLRENLVEPQDLIVDAKSGVSGAGRSPSHAAHFPEAAEGVRAYKVGGLHRHLPEMEQELSVWAQDKLKLTFTPHLVPMTRGILTTVYGWSQSESVTAGACTEAARRLYEGSPSIVVLDPGTNPDTNWVRGSNRLHVSYCVDSRTGRLIAQAAVDNLVKGAAGQALQAFNVRHRLEESCGLTHAATWP